MTKLLSTAIAAIILSGMTAPLHAADSAGATQVLAKQMAQVVTAADEFDRRGRGGRSKPRVPGGSGCDDPEDIIEHPECRR